MKKLALAAALIGFTATAAFSQGATGNMNAPQPSSTGAGINQPGTTSTGAAVDRQTTGAGTSTGVQKNVSKDAMSKDGTKKDGMK